MTKISNLYALTNYITANTSGNVVIVAPTSGTALYVTGSAQVTGQLTLGSTITNGTYTYTLPSATGTLALASSLGSYLPLAGGTMSGAIVGTTATFTNSGSGIGLGVTQNGSAGDGIKITHSAGRAFNILSSANGYGLIINNETIATSVPFTIQKQGANKIVFTDAGAATFAGALTGTSATFSGNVQVGGTGKASGWSQLNLADYNTGGSVSGVQIQLGSAGTNFALGFQGSAFTLGLTSNGTSVTSQFLTLAQTGAATFSSSITAGTYLATSSGNELRLYNSVNNANFQLFNSAGSGASSLQFYDTAAGSYRMTINSSGNVGIGTTSPGEILHVSKSTYPIIKLTETTASTNAQFGYDSPTQEWRIRTLQAYPLTLGTSDTERIRINGGNGFVGINTTPSYQFESAANTTNFAAMIRNNTSTFGNGIYLYLPNSSSSSTNEGFLRAENSAGIKAYIYTNGSYGSATGTYGSLVSDIRLKENVIEASSKLADIMKLRVVNFNLIEDVDKRKQIGFIAQEFKKVFPALVYQRDTREYDSNGNLIKGLEDSLGVSVGMEFAILTKAIQEQQAQIEELKLLITNK